MAPFWEALYDYGADVVIGGDDHLYERFLPQKPDGTLDLTHGITQFVSGTGGYLLYPFKPTPQPNSAARINDASGVLKLALHPAGYDWKFLPVIGKTSTDSGTAIVPRLGLASAAAPARSAAARRDRPVSGHGPRRHSARLLAARRGERHDRRRRARRRRRHAT